MNSATYIASVSNRMTAIFLAVITAPTLLSACGSKELNRARAADIIESSEAFKNPVTVTIQPEYRQSLALAAVGVQTTSKEEIALKRFFEAHPDLAVFNHLGLVQFKVSNIQYPNSAASPVTVTAALADAGRSASVEWQQTGVGWVIPIARRELVEVTGVAVGEREGKRARVEYTWRWKPLGVGTNFDTSSRDYQSLPEHVRRNPRGTSFTDVLGGISQIPFFDGGKTQLGMVTLRLYDDGWRIDGKN